MITKKNTTKTNIRMDRLSGVAKTVVGISPLLRADAPTLARLEHKEEFNNNEKYFLRVLTYI